MADEEMKSGSMSLHAHGDGSYHTHSPAHSGDGSSYYGLGEKDKSRKEHASFGAAVMHMAKHMGTEGDHMHIHGHDEGFTSHHVIEEGKVQGPDEHKNMRGLKAHVADCMDSDGAE